MAVFSPLTSRRSTHRKIEATQQLIVFRLAGEGFALPICAVQKVIPLEKVYGASGGGGVRLTLYQERELLVINVKERIFKQVPEPESSAEALVTPGQALPPDPSAEGYLLIVQSSRNKLVGLPLAAPPSLQRVPESAFTPLTSDYRAEGNIRCASALVLQPNDEPPLFLLNPDQLTQSQQALPGTTGTQATRG
jgi:purine-binding chemotaxis protein CheW